MRRAWMAVVVCAVGVSGCGDFVLVRDGETPMVPVAMTMPLELGTVSMLRFYGLNGILGEHLVPGEPYNEVQYGDLQADAEGVSLLQFTLDQFAGVDPMGLDGEAERLAFFLNLYNLQVLSGVVAELTVDPGYATVSVSDFAFFSTPRVLLGGHLWSLDQLEHGIMRGQESSLEGLSPDQRALARQWFTGIWGGAPVDARLHVGVNCSARSCPDLLPVAFTGDRVWDQLDAAATAFVDDTARGAGPQGVSQLFTWFEDDFVGSHGSVESFVEAYRTGGVDDVDFEQSLAYDWALNGQ